MLRPCGGFSDENVVEKAQVENLITNGNKVQFIRVYENSSWNWMELW